MEKGNARSSSSKSNSCESKNKQDVPNKYFRLPRVKDNISPRPDTRRKSNPQRNRELFDKRPRNKTEAVREKYWNEIADVPVNESSTKQGYKKTNLNHLLNFTFAPHDNWDGNARNHNPAHNRTKLPKYNKELFLQANCQFIARDNGNYSVHQKNPDILVEWSFIEEIRLPCHEVPLCPICLYVPVAAKITRCGHIYCWPCVLHYLALTDRTWQKCPICFEAVHKTELKSVSLQIQKSFAVGDEITLCLMKREKGSLLSIPVIEQKLGNSLCSINEVDSVTRYQKLLLASPKEIQIILNRERLELNQAYENEKDTPEACFIESAIKLLDAREHDLNQTLDSEINKELIDKKMNATSRKYLTSISSDSNDESSNLDLNENSFKSTHFGSLNCAQGASNDSDSKGVWFFYQAEDGQHIYLHNVNGRMLLKEYGSLEFAPPILTAKIVEIERVTMVEVLRKRMRYLQHLPLTCEFQLVELDFSHLVSELTVQQFESEIRKRKTQRIKKARDERRREKLIELEENKKIGKYPKATFNLNSADQFPSYNPEDFSHLLPPKNAMNIEQQVECGDHDVMDSRYSDATLSESNCVPVTSFAQMLKDGPKTFTQVFKDANKPSSAAAPQFQRTEDSDEKECTSAPEYRQSFSDAIQAALDAVTLQEPSNNQSSSKKKKKGKKLLFTTSMNRNN
ncbi:RING finger protein 10 [Trichonephila inaurata madagascariensis]|uniref:E3 ubiquitin-protein ligase RNF10 n=1 Tax=Trichonephila inaurata madagascariensis TaxID=2747483 RepID=A0A8X7C0W9_9ARAC|nr:RING finger protein 10 [Trichonephila inaurata madagascariensis]